MPDSSVDLEKLRLELRHLDRCQLLIVAERAIEVLPNASLESVVDGMIKVPRQAEQACAAASLLTETRNFYQASVRGAYFQSFDVNSKNCTEKSRGTDAFIAEFDRLTRKCVLAVTEGSPESAREPFEVLFSLLHRIDEDPDRIVFFADEAGSWQVPVDWRTVLPAYFQGLGRTANGEEFAREVDRTITEFCDYWRPQLLDAAQEVADDGKRQPWRGSPSARVSTGRKPRARGTRAQERGR